MCVVFCWWLTGVLRHNAAPVESHNSSSSSAGHERLTLDRSAAAAAHQALQCLCHVMSWVPLQAATSHAPPSLLTKLFHFATFGCRPACDSGDTIGAVAEVAVCCVNELLSKNQVPSVTCEQFVLALLIHMLTLVRSVTHTGVDSNDQIIMLVRFDQLTHRFASTCIASYSTAMRLENLGKSGNFTLFREKSGTLGTVGEIMICATTVVIVTK